MKGSTATERRKIGDIRPNQLLFTGGVVAIVELPNLSVMVMGLDDWPVEQGVSEISEPRLLKAVQYGLGPQVAKLLTPPVAEGTQRAILSGASNSWFPILLTVLYIPSTPDRLSQQIELNWAELEECESAREIKLKRKLLKGLATFSEEQIWEAVVKRKAGTDDEAVDEPDLREPEWAVFSNPDPNLNSRDFKLRVVEPPAAYKKVISKVVLAERLREVRALVGFTRIESPGDYTDIGDFPKDQRVSLARSAPKWVPTCEVRGEGGFLQFSEQAIQEWIKKTREREAEFFEGHRRWRQKRGLEPDDGFPTMRYVLLHSLAHALIRQFAIECGYTTASIRERIYSQAARRRSGADGGDLAVHGCAG